MTGRQLVAALAATALVATACGSDQGTIPYEDKGSTGLLALYDDGGRRKTSGNINEIPFAHYAVSTQKAQPPYDSPGRKAALMAFQPRPGTGPAQWGGDFLTGSTTYPDANHPTATGTDEDISLANFIAVFPPEWDGLIQLRIYLGAPQQPGLTERYVTADIRVHDQTWSVVRGADDISRRESPVSRAGAVVAAIVALTFALVRWPPRSRLPRHRLQRTFRSRSRT